MANIYDIGDLVRVTGTFTNAAGTAIDPTTVKAQIMDPSGNVSTLVYGTDVAVVRDSAGVYHTDISIDEAGHWQVRWYATGTGQSAGESYFQVLRSRLGDLAQA